jgi:hypothetical protein
LQNHQRRAVNDPSRMWEKASAMASKARRPARFRLHGNFAVTAIDHESS